MTGRVEVQGRPGAAGKPRCWRGNGRRRTELEMARCPQAGTSAASMVGTSDGAAWSNVRALLASWTCRDSRPAIASYA